MEHRLALLPDRGVVEITGPDRVSFLQGLVSNDVALAGPGQSVWAALLTPQGKWIFDFFIRADGERLLLDVQRTAAAAVIQRLSRFRLRAQVALRDLGPALNVYAAWGELTAFAPEALVAADPRLPRAGWRIFSATPLNATATAEDWERHRIELGLPSAADLESEKSVLLEAGFDELNGISWSKGCYMGQELTARTRYRGLVKRRLVPVAIDGPLPPPGTPVTRDGVEVGTMRSGAGGIGLAQLRLEALGASVLECGAARVAPRPPAWMRLPATAE